MLPLLKSPHTWLYLVLGLTALALYHQLASTGEERDTLTTSLTQKTQQVSELQTSLATAEARVSSLSSQTHTVITVVKEPDGSSKEVITKDTASVSHTTDTQTVKSSTDQSMSSSTQTAQTSTQTHDAGPALSRYSLALYWPPVGLSAPLGWVPGGGTVGARLGDLPVWLEIGVKRSGLRDTTLGVRWEF